MKTFWFLALFVFLIYFYDGFIEYNLFLSHKVSSVTPPFFSSKNPNANTVTNSTFNPPLLSKDPTLPIPNTEYTYKPNNFDIDDSENLKTLGLSCTPDSFGYSKAQGENVFPYHGYPKCSVLNNQNDTYLHIDRKENVLYMDCPKGNNGKIVTGPVDSRKFTKGAEIFEKWEVRKYSGKENAEKIEYGLATCEDDNEFMQASLVPIFNQTAYNMAKNKVTSKPKIIFFLTLDSMSRRHMFRKTPKIINFLNTLNSNTSSGFSSFDFKLHNILGPDSISNQVPIFGGLDKFSSDFPGNQNIDRLGDSALWNILREKGYISFLGLENCDNYFPGALGRNPQVDYSVNPFYCAVQKYTPTRFDKDYELVQRCLGGHQTHWYILNYTRTVAELNKGVNMLLYIHLNSAHESSGQHAETMNDDVTNFLDDFLKSFGKDHEIFIYLNADHGMRYGNWYKDLEAYVEQKLPSLFIIASKSLLDQFPYSYNSLTVNTERLTSKLDLRETTLYIAGIVEKTPYSVNLLEELSPMTRICEHAGIKAWDCSCIKMSEILHPTKEIIDVVDYLKNYAENLINSASYQHPLYPLGSVCKKVILENVTKIYHVSINNVNEYFKLEITSSSRKNMKFQINYILISDHGHKIRRSNQYRPEMYAFNAPVSIKILSISRIDKFAGPCEAKARNYGIKAEFCACVGV